MYVTVESAKACVCQLDYHLDEEPTVIKDGVTFKGEGIKLNTEKTKNRTTIRPSNPTTGHIP